MKTILMVAAVSFGVCSRFDIASAAVTGRFVDPVATDGSIRSLSALPTFETAPRWAQQDLRHYTAIDSDVAKIDRLLLFLPGSGGLPVNYRAFSNFAAARGFHVLNLAYPNWPAVRDLVATETDPDVATAIRRERIYGIDEYARIDVPVADSIVNRATKAVQWMAHTHPTEGWDAYLTSGGEIRWDRLVLSGHSQGAGHAAFMAQDLRLSGAILFAGPGDFVGGTQASWLVRPSATASSRYFGFTHLQDPTAAGFFLNQRTLGMGIYSFPVNVDTVAAPYLGSQMLATNLPPSTQDPFAYHGAVVLDESLALDAQGRPAYLPVWDYLLTGSVPEPEAAGLLVGAVVAAGRRRRR